MRGRKRNQQSPTMKFSSFLSPLSFCIFLLTFAVSSVEGSFAARKLSKKDKGSKKEYSKKSKKNDDGDADLRECLELERYTEDECIVLADCFEECGEGNDTCFQQCGAPVFCAEQCVGAADEEICTDICVCLTRCEEDESTCQIKCNGL